MATHYFVEGGILFRKGFNGEPLRCLGTPEAQSIMQEVHASECGNHQGKKRLLQQLLNLRYFWPTMKQDTAKHVKTCDTCQVHGSLIHTHPTNLQNMTTPWPFHTWGLDLIGPINLPSNGYIWMLLAMEYFTKWVEAVPLKKATGPTVANFVYEHIICRFGIPHKIVSDNCTPFVNKDVHKLLDHRHIKHRKSTPYYPQGNGQAKATNRVLLRILSKMVHEYEGGWSEHLLETLWANRSSAKTATGFSPFSLMYGTEAISPVELLVPTPKVVHGQEVEMSAATYAEYKVSDLETLEEARNLAIGHIQWYQQQMANAYNKVIKARTFVNGQMVLKAADHVRRNLSVPFKFAPNWVGPYLIREANESGYYHLATTNGEVLAEPGNGKWLKLYYA